MKCKCCGHSINSNDRFCQHCGAEQYNYNYNYNYYNYNNENEAIARAYVGPKYDILMNKTFSWPTFFFGPAYFLYRKMYLFGFLFFLVSGMLFGDFIISIIVSFCFKSIYRHFVDNMVVYIKQKNPGASQEQLCEIARKKGGTSILAVIIVCLIEIAIISLAIFLFVFSFKYDDGNLRPDYDDNEYQEEYNEETRDETTINSLYIEIPGTYKVKSRTKEKVVYNGIDSCSITISKNKSSEFNNLDYSQKEINGYLWFYKTESLTTFTTTYYRTDYKNSTFEVIFSCPTEQLKNHENELLKIRDSMAFEKNIIRY